MRKARTILLTIFLFAVLFVFMSVTSSATDVESSSPNVISGNWNNFSWSLDLSTGALTVGGSGTMPSLEGLETTAWLKHSKQIKSVTIEEGVTSIGKYAFSPCSKLTSVTISDSVRRIDSYAFYYCRNLVSVTVGANISRISDYAFLGCEKLVEVINYSSLSLEYQSTEDGYIAYYAKSIYGTKSDIENQNGFLFYKNYLIGYIGNDTDLVLPNDYNGSPYYFYKYVFCERDDLSSITIPDSIINIPDYAFYKCTGLTSITIHDNVTKMGNRAFGGCTSLTEIIFNATNMSSMEYGSEVFWDAGKNGEGIKVTIGKNVNIIPSYLFYSNSSSPKITSVMFEEGSACRRIGSNAFRVCNSLTSITIPNGVTYIGDYTFAGCASLASITISNGVTSIGDYMFSGCASLASITIPDGVTYIGDYTFSDCTLLASITIPDTVTSIGKSAFSRCASLASITIPNGVTSIEDYAFSGCTGLTEIYIPNSVQSIAQYTFSDCSNLCYILCAASEKPDNWHSEWNNSIPVGWGITFNNEPPLENINNDLTNVTIVNFPVYSGKEVLPNIVVTYDNTLLNQNKDYFICGENNINPSDDSAITIYGFGKYSGLKIKKGFKIQKESINNLNVYISESNFYYIGKPITPEVYVSGGGTTLKEGRDYEIAYYNNDKIGTASVLICGIGNYQGTVIKTFNISEPSVSNIRDVYFPSDMNTTLNIEVGETVYFWNDCDLDEDDSFRWSISNTSFWSLDRDICYNFKKAGEYTVKLSITYRDSYWVWKYVNDVLMRVEEVRTSYGDITVSVNVIGNAETIYPTTLTANPPIGEHNKYVVLSIDTSKMDGNVTTPTWSSSNDEIMSVDQYGKVTLKKPGTAIITATIGAANATWEITSLGLDLQYGHIFNYNPETCTAQVYFNNEYLIENEDYKLYVEKYENGFVRVTAEGCNLFFGKISQVYAPNKNYIYICSHQFRDWYEIKAPTCTETGKEEHKCSVCQEIETRTVDANGHRFGEWYETKAPTCTEAGIEELKCSVCQTTETRILDANGHTMTDEVSQNRVEPTCSTNGYYESVVYCSICNAELSREIITISKLGHNYSAEWTIDLAPTCFTMGRKSLHCIRCDDKINITVIPAYGHHNFGEWYETKAPTCTETGIRERKCLICQAVERRTDDANGHSFGIWYETKAPTCTEAGIEELKCSVCQTTETRTVDANGHSFGIWYETKAPTCTETGISEHICYICQATETRTVDANGHRFGIWYETKAPTCSETGTREHKCLICQATETRILDATDHPRYYTVSENIVETTCVIDGSYEKVNYCSVCDAELSRKTIHIYASGHIYDNRFDKNCNVCGAENSNERMSAGSIIAIIVSSVAVTGTGGFAIFWFAIKKKTWRDLILLFKK